MDTVEAAGLPIGDGHPPRIMGVLNVSEESPYDPSVFADPGEAAAYVDSELIDEGADVVDVGLESANKRFEVLSAEEELARLDTAVETIASVSGDAVFSIETRYHEVAGAALDRGFDMVNDICGFADPEMPRVCADYDVAVVKMASPPDLERPGAIEDVDDIYAALQREGFTDKTIVDPAFGGWSEAKTLAEDRETFRRLREFRALGRPILVSINRKNFLRELAGRPTEEALPVSLAATSMAVERGAHVIRTHDVAETRDAAIVGDAFARELTRDESVGVRELDVGTAGELQRHLDAVGGDGSDRGGGRGGARGTGESSDPAAGVSRSFLLDGLSPEGRETLASAAADRGLVCVGGDQRVVIAGPVRDLVGLADRTTAPESLARALARVRRTCR